MSKIKFEDFMEIQQLVADYCLHTDNADAEKFMECWVDKDQFGGYESGPFGTMNTWQEMYDFEKHHVGPGGMANGKRHQSTNIKIVPVSENEVLVTSDLLVVEVTEEPMIVASGRYENSVVVKTSKGWKFKKRKLDVDTGFFKLAERMGWNNH